jgi:hypothetical protein
MAKAELEQAIADLGLIVKSEFVPFSQSRHAKKDAKINDRSLNWRVSLCRMAVIDGGYKPGSERTLLTTDYSAGIAHCPCYKQRSGRNGLSVDDAEAITKETERGYAVRRNYNGNGWSLSGQKILPDSIDVIHALLSGADVLNYSTFEDWASDFGYDVDSRKAETIYRKCLENALALRNGVGDDGLKKLQEAAQDY